MIFSHATFRGTGGVGDGAARGIGRAVAARLGAEGAAVALVDRDEAAVAAAAEEIGGLALTCDVTDRSTVDAAVAAVVARYGRLDVLVNNVGVSLGTPFEAIDAAAWQEQAGPTLHGAVGCVQAALPHLLAAPAGGSVVTIGSVNGLAAFGDIVYSAAKAGLQSLTQNLAVLYSRRELARRGSDSKGIRFNLVAPGTVRTAAWGERPASLDRLARQYPAGRVGEPEDIAAAVAFLASDDASWITGIVLPVDGGAMTGPLSFDDLVNDR
ncbi:SDR family NAD(P)-dependent oxidoreductase [Asanoa siamensis]|uniref:Oxidoreductase n=1 Tax=Asanoa siamensis TaxID=926357 RepID=A0ABQ4CY62_9ACTN|nr:SDR family oxidoreductase [Asanoa siamensis]GIF75938.1 oxidoreductase [Asanoa siamensis]